MNVTCDKCNKRYSIADDKVRGKSVKIRCKQCQNLISVQGPAAAAGATATAPVTLTAQAPSAVALSGSAGPDPWGEERTRAMPAIDLNVQWFAMVKGKQLGPLDLKGLEGKVKLGEVSLRTYLWRQGMADWKRAADVPEVSSVFAGVAVAQQPPPPPARRPPPGRDVALANEMPAPEITGRKSGNGNGNGHGIDAPAAEAPLSVPAPARSQVKSGAFPAAGKSGAFPAAPVQARSQAKSGAFPSAKPAPAPAPEPAPAPAPAPVKAKPAAAEALQAEVPAAQAKSLNDLFADVPQPSASNLDAVGEPRAQEDDPDDATETKTADGGSAPLDPFAALGEADPSQAPPPGEATNFFIAQAGVNKRNPPWKIALFVGIPLLALVGGAYVLQMTHLVPMEVTRTNENGEEVKESFFSAGGVSALKDLLSGEAKAKRAAAEKRKAEAAERARKAKAEAVAAREDANLDDAPKSNKPPDKTLQALYGGTEKNDVGPRVHKSNEESGSGQVVAASGKWAEGANKVVGDHVKSFQLCVEEALHRNPNLKVGKVTLTLTIGTSGAVKLVSMDKFQGTDLGECISRRAKQIVFPGPEEPIELQVPLTLGVSVGP